MHRVVDRKPGRHDAAWRVDVHCYFFLRIVCFQEQELGDHEGRHTAFSPGQHSHQLNDRDFRQRMYSDRAVEPSGIRLEEFARFIRDERKTAERIVRASGPQPK